MASFVELALVALLAVSVTGTPGDDVLVGTPGNDVLAGLAGNDVLSGGAGSDDLSGGPGTDAVTYAGAAAVTVTLDDLANDGAPAEHDSVQSDIEDAYGSDAADTLTGSPAANMLDGGAGDDSVMGGGGEDALYGGAGDDRIAARDGRADTVDCGDGSDIAIVDELDTVSACEIVDRRPAVPRVDFRIGYEWNASGTATTARRLALHDLDPPGASVTLECTGPGCPAKLRTPVAVRGLDALPRLRGTRLRPGAVVEIRATQAQYLTRVVQFRVRRSALPAFRSTCAAPGSRRLRPCPDDG